MKSDAWCASMKYEFQTVVPCAKFAFDLLMHVVTQGAWRDLFLCVYWNKSEPWYVVSKYLTEGKPGRGDTLPYIPNPFQQWFNATYLSICHPNQES